MDWLGQQLRFSVFAKEAWDPKTSDLWSKISTAEPELDEQKPRERARRRVGNYRDGVGLEIHEISPFRADIFFVARAAEPQGDENLGKVGAILEEALSAVQKLLPHVPFEVTRVAVGAILLFPVEDRTTGYRQILSEVHSLRFDPDTDLSDLFFQLNRPRPSSVVSGVSINRLMKYSVMAIKTVRFDLSLGESTRQVEPQPRHYCRLELDLNTAPIPSGQTLDKAKLIPIFEELTREAIVIAAQGEPT